MSITVHSKPKLRNFSTNSAECACFAFLKDQSCEFRIFKRRNVTAELEKIRIVTFQLFYNAKVEIHNFRILKRRYLQLWHFKKLWISAKIIIFAFWKGGIYNFGILKRRNFNFGIVKKLKSDNPYFFELSCYFPSFKKAKPAIRQNQLKNSAVLV